MKSIRSILAFLLLFSSSLHVIYSQKDSVFALGEIKEIHSSILSEKRILNIYLPEGYNKNDTVKYPVIYLLDGSADEDFIHIAGIVQFANFPWVNILPKTIVVGIANVDRRRDFTYPTTIEADKKDYPTTGKSADFICFIEKELQHFIEKNYHVNKNKTIIGQSLGGLLATEILLKYPHLFNQYIIVSPSLWWDNGSLLKANPNFSGSGDISVYIAVGKEGKIMEGGVKKLVSILKQKRKTGLTVKFEYLANKDHATILHQAVYNAFEQMNKKR